MCKDCNKMCRSYECYISHKAEKRNGKGKNKGQVMASLCEQNWQCPDCCVNIKKGSRDITLHECGEMQCKVCHQYFLEEDNHLCYMRAFTSDVDPEKFIFYDFECTQEEGKHVPNFVVAHSICNSCEKESITHEATCKN